MRALSNGVWGRGSEGKAAAVREARSLVEAAHAAQKELARFDQRKVDRICEAMVQAALGEATRLGEMAVEETGFGVAADKREKNRFAAEGVWRRFREARTVGVVCRSRDMVEVASPRGVVAGFVPSTSPTSTVIFKSIICVKSRNALVLSPHSAAIRCTGEAARVVREAGEGAGLPPGAIGCATAGDREGAETLMQHEKTALILATGGAGLSRAAYSSGKPAYGAGPGNVPAYVERTADVERAVESILFGTCFDNGTICASEQSVVVDAKIEAAVRERFRARGAYFLSAPEANRLARHAVTSRGGLDPALVGRSAGEIARMAEIETPPGTRCLVVEPGGVGRGFPLSMEKLSPILSFYVEGDEERAVVRCLEVLRFGGMGHTAGIHTRSRAAAVAFGGRMPVSRVIVNTSTAHGAMGLTTALSPSLSMGCGAWGNNATSDNISPFHLMDLKRVAFGNDMFGNDTLEGVAGAARGKLAVA